MRRRRGGDPVRRRLVDLRLARGARRPRRARSSRSTSRAWTRCSRSTEVSRLARVQAGVFGPAPGGAAEGARLHVRPLPGLVHPLDARRLDRHALLGDAVRPLRRYRRPDQGPAGGHAVRDARRSRPVPATSTGPSVREMVLGSEGRLGIITEATVQVRRLPEQRHDPRLSVPDLRRRSGRDARHRRQRVLGVGHARLRRARDAVLVRDAQAADAARQAAVEGAAALPARGVSGATSTRCACRSSATRAASATSPRSGRPSARSSSATAACASAPGPGALYDQKKFDTPYIRDYLLDRGVAGRRLGDGDAVEPADRRSTTRSRPRRAAPSPSSAFRAT